MNHNQLAVVLYDNILPQFHSVRANLHDFTEFKLNGKQPFNIFETTDVSKTLKELTEKEFTWAVVITIGSYVQGQHTLFDTLDFAINENSPLCGHIINKNNTFYLDSQYFAIDLSVYKQLGCPKFEEVDNITLSTKEIDRSTDNAHDDYTPWWICPKSNIQTEYSGQGKFGIQVVSAYINAGYRIVNVPQTVRNQKNYSYPNYNYNDLVNLIADPEYAVPENTGLFWFNKELQKLTDSLKYGYYVFNTEIFTNSQQLDELMLDCFVGVCGGFKPVCIVGKNNFADNTRIYLFDISQAAIDWQKFLRAHWDGDFDKFESVCNQFQLQNPNHIPLYHAALYHRHDRIPVSIDMFLSEANLTREEFYTRWQKYLNMHTEFVNLNLLDDNIVDALLAFTQPATKGAYIWTSNAFFMDYIMFFKTRAWTNQKQTDVINELTVKTKKTIVLDCGYLTFIVK
jgi:hypothetical protein